MSYNQTVDNKVVYFREEEDYLDCRMQYLKYCRDAVMPEATFIQYIQNGMYPTRITVENIVSVIDHWIPTESSFAVGNDSGNIAIGSAVQFATGHDVHIEGNLVVSGEVTSSNIIGTTISTTGQYNADDFASSYYCEPVPAPTYDVKDLLLEGGVLMPNGKVVPDTNSQAEKKDAPSCRIENRWDILDLRGYDNEHD